MVLNQLEDAELDVLYVSDLRQYEVPLMADLGGSLGVQPYQAIITQLEEIEETKANALLGAAKAIFTAAGQEDRIKTHHSTGLLVDSLREFERPYDLILLGKRGLNSEYAQEHIGSTVERVVRASNKPCLVTSREFHPVSDVKGEDYALKNLREAEDTLSEVGIAPVCQMLPGLTEDAISSYVVESDISMLLMGAYGHSRIRQLLIGSTTTEMIRRCHIPLMLFR
jgi:nucleotide-binding universal stress UspA family protein